MFCSFLANLRPKLGVSPKQNDFYKMFHCIHCRWWIYFASENSANCKTSNWKFKIRPAAHAEKLRISDFFRSLSLKLNSIVRHRWRKKDFNLTTNCFLWCNGFRKQFAETYSWAVHLSCPCFKIRAAQGTNQNSFHLRPVCTKYNKSTFWARSVLFLLSKTTLLYFETKRIDIFLTTLVPFLTFISKLAAGYKWLLKHCRGSCKHYAWVDEAKNFRGYHLNA